MKILYGNKFLNRYKNFFAFKYGKKDLAVEEYCSFIISGDKIINYKDIF